MTTFSSQPGVARRKAILALFDYQSCLAVNNKWQYSTRDPDLAYLMKKGLLMQTRRAAGPKGGKGQTYLERTGKPSPYPRGPLKTSELSAPKMLRLMRVSGARLYRWRIGAYCIRPEPAKGVYGSYPGQPWIPTKVFVALVQDRLLTQDGELALSDR